MQQNIHNSDTTVMNRLKKGSQYDRDTKLKSRERTMQQLEGGNFDRKVVSMTRIASPKFLDERLAEATATGTTDDPMLLMNKAQYDAVVSGTIQQQRRPSMVSSPVPATQTGPPKVSTSPRSNSKFSTTTTISPFLPTPSSSSSHQYLPPPPSSSICFPSTPNSLDSYL
jgi:hypothetical protein